jgi:hypothetical protein
MSWLRRWLKGDTTVDAGPRLQWLDDGGTWRSAPDYPLAPAGAIAGWGAGTMTLIPTASATLGPYLAATPSTGALEVAYAAPVAETDIVGAPTVTLTYHGRRSTVSSRMSRSLPVSMFHSVRSRAACAWACRGCAATSTAYSGRARSRARRPVPSPIELSGAAR